MLRTEDGGLACKVSEGSKDCIVSEGSKDCTRQLCGNLGSGLLAIKSWLQLTRKKVPEPLKRNISFISEY